MTLRLKGKIKNRMKMMKRSEMNYNTVEVFDRYIEEQLTA